MGIRANTPHNDYLIELVRATLLHTQLPDMPADCDANALASLIRSQQLVSLIYPELCRHPHLQSVRASLEKAYMMQIPKVTNQDLEIEKWLDAAEAAGIDCIPMKGYWLRKLYPSPLMRSMTDFDVLLRHMDRDAIRPWMESLGYTPEEEKEISHHDNYIKKPWMYIELHKHLTKPRPGREELERKVWAHSTPVPGKQHIYQMSLEDFYIFHLLHMYKHFTTRGLGLKSIIDIYFFLQAHGKDLDQTYLQQELKALGIHTYAAYMEKLADIWLGDGESDSDSKLVTDYIAGCGMFGTAKHYHTIRMVECGGNRSTSKFRYRLKLLFPDVQTMAHRFPSVLKFPYLLPFYWVARVFRSIFVRKTATKGFQFDHFDDQEYDQVSHIMTLTGVSK